MIDIVDSQTRSRMMAGIRSKDTVPELLVRKALHQKGYRFRLSSKALGFKPDVVLRSRKIAVFVHGCYWHQHAGCRLAYSDRRYSESWKKKFEDNKARDQRVEQKLLSGDWRVAVIWECATRNPRVFAEEMSGLEEWIKQPDISYFETRFKAV